MLVAPSPVEAIPLMSPPAAIDRSPAAGTPGPAAAPPASAVSASGGVSRLAHQVPAAPTAPIAPAVTVANAAATTQRSCVACGIHDQEANRNSHRHPPKRAGQIGGGYAASVGGQAEVPRARVAVGEPKACMARVFKSAAPLYQYLRTPEAASR